MLPTPMFLELYYGTPEITVVDSDTDPLTTMLIAIHEVTLT